MPRAMVRPMIPLLSRLSSTNGGAARSSVSSPPPLQTKNIGANLVLLPTDVDAGTYVITSTLTIPAGTFVVGELWSNIQASGSYFASASSPQVAVRVGAAGSTAATEISDIVFTSTSGSAGAILVEWNVGSTVQGSAAMWDSHVRLGGYLGSGIQVGNCGTGTSHPTAACTAAFLSLHVTSGASAYFENVWLWTGESAFSTSVEE